MKTVVVYERLKDSIPAESIIAQNEDGSYSIRHIEEVRLSMITCVSSLSEKIEDLYALYYMLPCAPSNYDKFCHSDGHVITSVRWRGMTKGEAGGYFPNSIFLNIHAGDYFISARISKETLQASGLRSLNDANELFLFIARMINWCGQSYAQLKEEWLHTMEASKWVEDYARGEYIGGEEGGFVTMWPLYAPDKYYDIVATMRDCYTDIYFTNGITQRTIKILNSGCLPKETVNNFDTKVCLMNYNFDIGFSVDRESLCNHLRILGNPAMYYNVKDHEVKITCFDDNYYEDDQIIKRKGRKMYETTIKITMKGKITISGGGGERLEKAYIKVLSDIVKICSEHPSVMIDYD